MRRDVTILIWTPLVFSDWGDGQWEFSGCAVQQFLDAPVEAVSLDPSPRAPHSSL